jgi:hypothetical protein
MFKHFGFPEMAIAAGLSILGWIILALLMLL